MNKPLKTIAHIKTEYKEKFGIPRQSDMVSGLPAEIIFEPEYRNPDAIRGLDGFSHIWLIWQFSKSIRNNWSPTVRPPRLGGNKRMGVFATRSPFRPNPLGLSSVRLEKIEMTKQLGPILHVSGVDLLDNTPIYDIKPYLPFTDSHPDAVSGFAEDYEDYHLDVQIPHALAELLPTNLLHSIREILSLDPRPSYQNNPGRIYGMDIADYSIKFTVDGRLLTVVDIQKQFSN